MRGKMEKKKTNRADQILVMNIMLNMLCRKSGCYYNKYYRSTKNLSDLFKIFYMEIVNVKNLPKIFHDLLGSRTV